MSTSYLEPAQPTARRQSLFVRWWKALGVHFVSMIISVTVFTLAVVFLSVGAGLVVIWIGLPIMVATLWFSHGYGRLKKALARWQGAADWEDLPPSPHRKGVFGWMWKALTSTERWREFGYATVGALLDFLLATVAVAIFGFGVGELCAPFVPYLNGMFESFVEGGLIPPETLVDPTNLAIGSGTWWDFASGVVLIFIWIPLVWFAAKAEIGLTRLFLQPSRQAIAARLRQAEQARLSGQQAESASLVRIERDLHDGPQQRLIRTGLDLASLERRLEAGDTEGARSLLTEVRARNDETIAEIRTLSRGFAPPILAEQGLKEAVASLAATSPIPASLSTELAGPRPPEAIERAVYFTVSEALANAAKYSGASGVMITLRQNPYGLVAQVTDNGRGGAQVLPGHGLQGLADRLNAVGGAITISSPAGQGTTVRVEVAFK